MIICCIGAKKAHIELDWNMEKGKKNTPNVPAHLSIWFFIENKTSAAKNSVWPLLEGNPVHWDSIWDRSVIMFLYILSFKQDGATYNCFGIEY